MISEFGDLRDQAESYDPARMDRDYTYVPGFSEMRRDVALQMAEVRRGERAPKDVVPLPVNLHWARNADGDGKPNSAKQFGHARKGYRLASGKPKSESGDVGEAWLKELPPGTRLGADGSIINGDTVLMVCTAAQARKNEFTKRRLTEERMRGAEGAFARLIESARGVNPGATPTTEKLPVQKQPAK